MTLEERLQADLAEAECKAWDALSRYKFWMFGYWAADWVKINRRLPGRRQNPFTRLVALAKTRRPLTTQQRFENRQVHGHFGAGGS